jgi:hypothetical protein
MFTHLDRALAVVKLLLRDAVQPGEKRIGRWRLWKAHRRSEAKRGRESRHQLMIDRFEQIAALSTNIPANVEER